MNKVISFVKKFSFRQVTTVLLVVLTVFVIQSFGYGSALQAQANNTVESSEGIYYKGTPDGNSITNQGENLVEKGKSKVKEGARNLGKQLNSGKLDVETPEGRYYKATPEHAANNRTGGVIDNVQQTAQNIKEKLNLDEPLPKSTKDFLNLDKDR